MMHGPMISVHETNNCCDRGPTRQLGKEKPSITASCCFMFRRRLRRNKLKKEQHKKVSFGMDHHRHLSFRSRDDSTKKIDNNTTTTTATTKTHNMKDDAILYCDSYISTQTDETIGLLHSSFPLAYFLHTVRQGFPSSILYASSSPFSLTIISSSSSHPSPLLSPLLLSYPQPITALPPVLRSPAFSLNCQRRPFRFRFNVERYNRSK